MILEEILEAKRGEVEAAKHLRPEASLRRRPLFGEQRRGFERALRSRKGRRVIAEIKRRSPSRGTIRERFDPEEHARDYERHGATCLSVLTDRRFFGGMLEDLERARGACRLPLLRKDFLVDEYQIIEARAFGADAVLLIVAALTDQQLKALLDVARTEGLDALVEVHTREELERAVEAGATMVGINNRDLRTFETSVAVTRQLAPLVPGGIVVVSESGLAAGPDLADLERLGVDAFLVGEAFMRAPSPGAALASFLRA
ncbi:MAG: indole-3-glycerol phosphate synthase TrpC [Candidatus Dadabacteria bacterium]|nr:MAG: indole-3-glycerol phosphate synthase TrpC [Candidatus Dadabacteria bacterium]